jgi:predicted CXXCH cytochrome family protein
VKAAKESEVCIFCHAPHNSSPVRPLWNRQMPTEAFTIYGSRALAARPGQPTGVSKMCLSCHDGTIALGTVLSRDQPIVMARGATTLTGAANLGTDLSDDHPISFRYDTTLTAKNARLKDPSTLPASMKLDSNSELQCTTCHDAHNNSLGKFLVMRNDASEMCKSCHNVGPTEVPAHQNCDACHQPHTAPSGPYLLRSATVAGTCNRCHDGSVTGAANIAAEMQGKPSVHDTGSPVDPPAPAADHTTCTDCHEPHTMGRGASTPPSIPPNFGKIGGITNAGAPIAVATSESQACYKCHADTETRGRTISRKVVDNNTRQQFSPSAISFHPVEGPGRNLDVPSLVPGLTESSRITCSSCHASESAASGGVKGTHGSMYTPLLTGQYTTQDLTTESSQEYALCYQCHDRANLLSDASFPTHKLHIVDQRTSCAACHDSHGISSSRGSPGGNSKLINFATSVVFPEPSTGRLEYVDQGRFAGQCFLSCHGKDHVGTAYPAAGLRPGAPPAPAGIRRGGIRR